MEVFLLRHQISAQRSGAVIIGQEVLKQPYNISVATLGISDRSERRNIVRASFKKEFLSWEFFFVMAFILLKRFWILPLTYVFLSSFLIAPNGIIPWVAIILMPLTFVWLMVSFTICAAKQRKLLQKRIDDNPNLSQQEIGEMRQQYFKGVKSRGAKLSICLLPALIPPLLSLAIFDEISGKPLVKKQGHIVSVSDRERVQIALKNMRQNGLITKFP